MKTLLVVSNLVLWAVILGLGFLLVGTLRSLGLLTWRLEQLELTRPSRIGREGLKVGEKAPDFTLPSTTGEPRSLSDFSSGKVLLVFTQSGCGPCHDIIPELNRLHERGEHQVVVINNSEGDGTREWAADTGARFPVLVQEKFAVSKRYEVFATPFAFVIDQRGTIMSKGIVGSRQYLSFVLSGAGNRGKETHKQPEGDSKVESAQADTTPEREPTHA
jgi:methylamine dehydrogenase accessory protein MauD